MKSPKTLGNLCFTLAMMCALSPTHAQTPRFTGDQSLLQIGHLTYGGETVDGKGHVFISEHDKRQLSLITKPVSFEPNVGQAESSARFLTRGEGYAAYISTTRTEFQLGPAVSGSRTVTMDLLNANIQADIQGVSPLPGTVNYFAGSGAANWHAKIPTYSRVGASGVYPGIDLAFYGTQKRLEYDFIIQAQAQPQQIRLQLSGSDNVALDANGDLVLRLGNQQFRLLKPVAYQLLEDGSKDAPSRRNVSAAYELIASGANRPVVIGFTLGKYDHSVPLVIDPVLTYSESLDSYANAVAVDSVGNTYTVSGYQFDTPMYVTKFSPSGTVIYDAKIGATGLLGTAIAVDNEGQAYITGNAGHGAALPTGANSFQPTPPAEPYGSAFLVKLAANGESVPYASYLSGKSSAQATAIALDAGGNAYVAGLSEGSDFPTTPGVYQDPGGPGPESGFISKFDTTKSGAQSVVYSLLIGPSNGYNFLYGIAVDPLGNAYVTGNLPTGYPVTPGAFNYTGYASGAGGVYVTKLNPTATSLLYSAYLGDGTAYSIAVDAEFNAYVTGTVGFADFPTTTGAYQTLYPGGFVTKLNPAGSGEIFSTFLGGPSSYTGNVLPLSLAITPGCSTTSPTVTNCNVYVAGWTGAADYPTSSPIQSYLSNSSAFVTELAPDGESAVFSTYLSGGDNGIQYNLLDSTGKSPLIAVDGSGNINLVANLHQPGSFPLSISSARTGNGFLAKISAADSPALLSAPASVNFGIEPVGLSTHLSGGTAIVRLMNLGSVAASLSSIQITPAAFVQTNSCGTSIPAGGYCSFNVDFAPSTAGAYSGEITVTSSQFTSPETITLTATAQDEAFIQASAASVAFPVQNIETSSSARLVTITNAGTQPGSVSFSLGTSEFSEINDCPAILAPHANCIVSLTFNPSQPGLQEDSLLIKSTNGAGPIVALTGTGETPLASHAVTLSATALTFTPQTVGTARINEEMATITNSGSDPITLNSITATGDFSVGASECQYPFPLNPQQSCSVGVNFAPTTSGTRTGTLSFSDTAGTAPQTVSLTGTGMASTENLEFYPSAAVGFPNQVVNTSSSLQNLYVLNTGSSPLIIDRVLASGDYKIAGDSCSQRQLQGTTQDGAFSEACQVQVEFMPAAAGSRTGTVTFIDSSAASPHIIQLTGNGVAAAGTLALDVTNLNFGTQAVGATGPTQLITLHNPGNAPLGVGLLSINNNDFTLSSQSCPPGQFSIAPLSSCTVAVAFSPTVTGSRSGKLNIVSAAGTTAVQLDGTGVTETQTLQLTPASGMDFGTAGQKIFVQNSGSAPVTFTAIPTITGTDAGDFAIVENTCGYAGTVLPVNAGCYVTVSFSPSARTPRTASLTFTDSASGNTQSITLTGTATQSSVTPSNKSLTFAAQIEGTTSKPTTSLLLYNYTNSAVTLGTVAATGNFLITHGLDGCSGQTLAVSASCQVYVQFAPPLAKPATNAYSTGTLVFVDSTQVTVATAALSGYGLAPTIGSFISSASVNFVTPQVVTTTSTLPVSLVLTNTGNTPLSVGKATVTNIGPLSDFDFLDECSNQTIQPGGTCQEFFLFTPAAVGTRIGSISYPVTYANGSIAALSASLTGNGIAEKNSALLTPVTGSFIDQTVATTSFEGVSAFLTNEGNEPLTVGALTGSVTGEFSTSTAIGGEDGCSHTTVQPGGSCLVTVMFTPSAAGQRTGSVVFPVVYRDKTTSSLTLSLTGKGITPVRTIQVSVGSSLYFGEQAQGSISYPAPVAILNTGNAPVTIAAASISTSSTDFSVQYNSCAATTLNPGVTCSVGIVFNPAVTSPIGIRKAIFTLADNAVGGPHMIQLSGVSLSTQQELVLSATTLSFPMQALGTTSPAQSLYLSNQGSSPVSVTSISLAGANAADFKLLSLCPGPLAPQQSCNVLVSFAPSALGARNATLNETDSSSKGGGRHIQLSGVGVAPLPQVTFLPGAVAFPLQKVGTVSAGQSFSITNTGSAKMQIANVSSTSVSEFPLTADSCIGATLAVGQECLVTVAFSPKLGGARTSGIQVTSNAPSKTLSVSGLALGIPKAVTNASSLSFGNQNTGSSSAAQNITLLNSGTDTLNIVGVIITGANASDYAIVLSDCASTLAPSSSCGVAVAFTPSAAGARVATLTYTDNANNTTGSTQTVALTGTGLSAPQAAASPSSLTFAVTTVGSTTTAQTVTVTNGGAAVLTIGSIKLGGSNPGDFASTTTCGTSLSAGGACTVSVTFTPAAAGSRSARLTITDNANKVTGSTQVVALSGTGEVVPKATLSPTSMTFASTKVGVMSAIKTVTLTNPGTASLNITSITSSGTEAAEFAVTTSCAGILAPGTSCTISVTFQPAATGARSATLIVTDNADYLTGSAQTAALSGTGS